MKANARILFVEDDPSLGFLVKDALENHGWHIHLCASGETGLTAFHSHDFDLCVLDVMLPHKDGFTLASDIRKYNQSIPIIFLTAKSQTADRIKGFQIGADDYVSKPFSIEEFKYRVEAVLKRSQRTQNNTNKEILRVSNSTLDAHNHLLDANGQIHRLTYKEMKLLQLFFKHAGKLVERDVFLKTIWEEDGFFVARSMDVFVSKLRKYLAKDENIKIENIRGIGYIMKVTGKEVDLLK